MLWFTHTQKKEKRKKKRKRKNTKWLYFKSVSIFKVRNFSPKADFGLIQARFRPFLGISVRFDCRSIWPNAAWFGVNWPDSVHIGPSLCRVSVSCEKKIIKIKNKKNWTWHRRTGSGVPHALSRRTRVRQAICRVHASQLILLQITNCSIKNNLWMGLDMLKIKFISSIPNYPSSHCPSF